MFDLSTVESAGAGALKAGEKVKVTLEKVEISEDGKGLDLFFKGAEPANPGAWKHRYWTNNFDPTDENYAADPVKGGKLAGDLVKQLKQLLEAYLDNDAVAKVKGASALEFFTAFVQALNPGVTSGVVAEVKAILKYNSDTDLMVPRFGPFISTEFRTRSLTLGTKVGADGMPYDRVLPMADYGVAPDAGAPKAAGDAPFGGGETAAPAFGS